MAEWTMVEYDDGVLSNVYTSAFGEVRYLDEKFVGTEGGSPKCGWIFDPHSKFADYLGPFNSPEVAMDEGEAVYGKR